MKTITLARKPFRSTVAKNILEHGSGGLNIEGCRIGSGNDRTVGGSSGSTALFGSDKPSTERPTGGRFPANLILQHLKGCRCDGVKKVKSGTCYEPAPKARENMIYGDGRTLGRTLGYADKDGKEPVANWVCVEGCPVKALDDQSGISTTGDLGLYERKNRDGYSGSMPSKNTTIHKGDTGGASRFFKQVKS